jgi:hypothetical protein
MDRWKRRGRTSIAEPFQRELANRLARGCWLACVTLRAYGSARNLLIINFGVIFTSDKFTYIICHAFRCSFGCSLQRICIAEAILFYCQSRDEVRYISLKLRRDAAMCFGRDSTLNNPQFLNILFVQTWNTNVSISISFKWDATKCHGNTSEKKRSIDEVSKLKAP